MSFARLKVTKHMNEDHYPATPSTTTALIVYVVTRFINTTCRSKEDIHFILAFINSISSKTVILKLYKFNRSRILWVNMQRYDKYRS